MPNEAHKSTASPLIRLALGVDSMSKFSIGIKAFTWVLLLAICVFVFNLGSYEINKNIGLSIPEEVLIIIFSAILLVPSYLLLPQNRYFKLALWVFVIISTLPLLVFIVFSLIDLGYGLEIGFFIFIIVVLFCSYWFQRKSPNK